MSYSAVAILAEQGVSRLDLEAVYAGIGDINEVVQPPLEAYELPMRWGDAEPDSLDWHVTSATHPSAANGHQVHGQQLFDSLAERLEVPDTDIVLVVLNKDLTHPLDGHGDLLPFTAGFAVPTAGFAVQSIHRFLGPNISPTGRAELTRLTTRHELAHLLGILPGQVANEDRRGGVFSGHCLNLCSMQQVESPEEALHLAQSLESVAHGAFCDHCKSLLLSL